MAQDEPIRLTAEEAQTVINAQREEIAGLRSALEQQARRFYGLSREFFLTVTGYEWCDASYKREAERLRDE